MSPRDSQESSPTPQFKSINSLMLSLLYCPILTSIHDYLKNQRTLQTFVSKVMSLLFNNLSGLVITSLPRSKRLNFKVAVTICSDFGAQENKICHYFHLSPIFLSRSDGTGCQDVSFLNVEF